MKKYGALVLLCFYSTISFGQRESSATRLSAFIDDILKTAPQIPGLSIVVVQGDSILFEKGFGWANVENRIEATSHTGFYIASTTKSFTALLAASLASRQKLNLTNPITNYAPFNRFKNRSLFENVSINDLLTHQSGLSNDVLSIKMAYAGNYSAQMINNIVDRYTIRNKDGKAFVYSNLGYYLFSLLLKEEFGLDWRELLRDEIFQPLKMSSTTAYMTLAQKRDLAMPYMGILSATPQQGYLMKEDDTMHAAGGIVSTASDIGRWLMFQLHDGSTNRKELFPSDVVEMTHLRKVSDKHNYSKVFDGDGYALGWRVGEFKGLPLIYHFGGYPGFFSHISFVPKAKIGVAIFVNHDLGSEPGNIIAEYAYDLYMGNTPAVERHEKETTKKLVRLFEEKQEAEMKSNKHFAQRKWQLTLPKAGYAGTYANADLGEILVKLENDQIIVSFGHTRSVATAIESPDIIRVELIPGEGIGLKFTVEENRVTAITIKGIPFSKIN